MVHRIRKQRQRRSLDAVADRNMVVKAQFDVQIWQKDSDIVISPVLLTICLRGTDFPDYRAGLRRRLRGALLKLRRVGGQDEHRSMAFAHRTGNKLYDFEQLPKAMEHSLSMRTKGKVVVRVK